MTLDLFVFVEREKLDERLQEARVDDGRFVGRVDRHVPDASCRGENKREVGRVKETQKGLESVGFDDFKLVFFCNQAVDTRFEGKDPPSLARFRRARAAWHCTFRLWLPISVTRLWTSFVSLAASFLRLFAMCERRDSGVMRHDTYHPRRCYLRRWCSSTARLCRES